MKPFTKQEIFGLSIIFLILLAISIPNFALSFKRARDNTRKADLGTMVYGMGEYQKDLLTFPLSNSQAEVVACIAPGEKIETDSKGRLIVSFIPCKWGFDALYDPRNENKEEAYIKTIPNDPQNSMGAKYLYFSSGRHFQVYAALEANDDDQYDEAIVRRNLMCGNRICNTGRSDSVTPLDKSIEEYENELMRKSQGL